MKDQLDQMEELTTILDGVHDAASAKAAKPKIEKIKQKMLQIGDDLKKLKALNPDELQNLDKKYKERRKEVTSKMLKSMRKALSNPEAAKILNDCLNGD